MMRALLALGLLAASGSPLADPFEFAGLSRATTPQDIARRYPNSALSGSYVHVSPKDAHDHIFGIELFGPKLSSRLRINFESPDRKFPPCEPIEKSIVSRHGPPAQVREFREEAMQNRHVVWKLELDIAVHPAQPGSVRRSP